MRWYDFRLGQSCRQHSRNLLAHAFAHAFALAFAYALALALAYSLSRDMQLHQPALWLQLLGLHGGASGLWMLHLCRKQMWVLR